MLALRWTFVSFKTTEMLFQLDFDNCQYVSQKRRSPDQIKLTIYGFHLFADTLGNYMNPATELEPKALPIIITQSEAATAQAVADTVKGAMQSAMLVNTIVSFAISGPIQQLLSSVKQLQIIVHITLIDLAYPGTATIFMGMLMNVLTFQIISFSDFYNRVFGLDPDSVGNNPLNNLFNMLGYGSLYIIQNFGALCWTIFIAPIGWAVSPLVVYMLKGEYSYLKIKFNRLMFYNYWIGFLNEAYLFLAVCASLNFKYFTWHKYGDVINSFLALFCYSALVLFPVFVGAFYSLKKNYQKIKDNNQEFVARFGNAIQGLNFKRQGKIVIAFICVSFLRKFTLAYMLVFQQSKPIFSIFLVNFQALMTMVVSGLTEPMIEKTANKMDLVNEAFVLLTTYHLYQFTEFMPDLDNRSYTGKSLMLLIIFNVVVNIGVVLVQTSALTIRKLKLRFMESKQRRRIKKQQYRTILKAARKALRNKIALKDAQIERRAERSRLQKLAIQGKTQTNQGDQNGEQSQKKNQAAQKRLEFDKKFLGNQLKQNAGINNLKSALKNTKPKGDSQLVQPDASRKFQFNAEEQTQNQPKNASSPNYVTSSQLIEAKPKQSPLRDSKILNADKNSVQTFTQAIIEQPKFTSAQTKTLGRNYLENSDKKIEFKEVIQAGRVVRFMVLVDGVLQHSYFVSNQSTQRQISQMKDEAKQYAINLSKTFERAAQQDFPVQTDSLNLQNQSRPSQNLL